MVRALLVRLLAFAALGLVGIAHGEVKEITPPQKVLAAAQRNKGAITVKGYFQGPGNLIGVASLFAGKPMIFFYDPDGRWMVSGIAIDTATGKNLVAEASSHFFKGGQNSLSETALPTPTKSSVTAGELADLAFFEEGAAKRKSKAYVFFDFDCVHCGNLYKALRGSVGSITGALRWVPISLSGRPGSETRAALVLGGIPMDDVFAMKDADLQEAVTRHKAAFAKGALALERNMSFASGTIKTTPTFFYERGAVMYEHHGFAGTGSLLKELGITE